MPRFNTQHYFNFLLSTHAITPSSTSLPDHRLVNALCTETSGGKGMRRFMSYGKEYLRRRNQLERVANFHQVIRILRVNFSHHFAALFEHSVIFCVNESEKFIIASILAWKTTKNKERQGVKAQNWAWVTNILETK